MPEIFPKTLIVIVGPTAIGKTALSIQLAQHFKTEILSCDSRQFYKEMTIGTAVPSTDELEAAKHHFIQNRSVFEDYNVGQFEVDALKKITEIFSTNSTAIMVGGSGLYIDAVVKGLDSFPKVDPSIRVQLNEQLENKGIESLQMQLKELDLKSYNTIALDNPHRLIRALEICIGSNQPYSSFINKDKKQRKFNILKIGLEADRSVLYDRINQRVDLMVEAGLFEEALELHKFKDLNALQTVGYREPFAYFDGLISKEKAIEEIKKNSRRFAKRQLTWFRKDPEIVWFAYDKDFNEISKTVEQLLPIKM
ncbi:tRNA dimethylallyltransferase [Polaribacter pacificus]|uniref:tRNA dimethylallyltransferase n=1 Tax=Polaribacter pacificus TaxID=1775173 RepID=A0A917I055_9FLAO|nr:tRNA (adenosine(37)-N6)-dimethylallyltransferase MiaA [Polaribacter pacificus]GGG99289.1 tRNA dimethylallyltransferase [Polaribacter pacificus]